MMDKINILIKQIAVLSMHLTDLEKRMGLIEKRHIEDRNLWKYAEKLFGDNLSSMREQNNE